MKFSIRKGFREVRSVIQVDDVSRDTRSRIWNILHLLIWDANDFANPFYGPTPEFSSFTKNLWHNFYERPVDTIPGPQSFVSKIRKEFFEYSFYDFYDFLEFVLQYFQRDEVNDAVNRVFEEDLVGYRYINGLITDVTDPQEVEMVQAALISQDFPHVREHLARSLELLSDRKRPDYRNSIKESISAVESMAKEITGKPKAELSVALSELEKTGKLHPALKKGFVALYGYTSDAHGIRHSLLEESDLTADDAKYFFLTCTSFINYLKTKM